MYMYTIRLVCLRAIRVHVLQRLSMLGHVTLRQTKWECEQNIGC